MKRAIILLAAAGAIRLLVGALVPLYEDEAYYWVWALNPAAGYFDHPPAIAWLIGAGLPLLGDSFLGVRRFPILGGSSRLRRWRSPPGGSGPPRGPGATARIGRRETAVHGGRPS